MSLITRRRAIYTGLSGYLSLDELLAAVALWESKYADKPSCVLNEFLAELADTVLARFDRAKVYRDLISVLSYPDSALLPEPEPLLSEGGQHMHVVKGPPEDQTDQAQRTLEELAGRLFNGLDTGLVARLRMFVTGNLNVLTGSHEQRLQVRNWLEQSSTLEGALLSPSQLRQLLNLLYVGMCEYLGPAVADQRMSQAVHQAETVDLVFAPDKLL